MKCRNFAHRGFSGMYPENTMLAFEKALEAGCEGIEFDVHFTKDKVLVICHDERIDRTSDSCGLIRDMTYEELCRVNFNYPGKFDGKFPFQRIPTLREYFQLVKDKHILSNIELKTGVFEYDGIEKAVYDMIREFGLQDEVVISSFNHHSVMRMKQIDPKLYCGFLAETWILDVASYIKDHQVEAYHPQFRMLTPAEVADLKAHQVKINTWTVNEVEDIRQMIAIGVDGIISNFPDRVGAELKAAGLR